MIVVHHLNNSRSQRILWLLEELGQEYTIQFYQRDPQTQLAPAELKKIHPLGKSPVLSDGDKVLAESGAIIDYLASTYGADSWVPPRESPNYLNYQYWLHYAEGSLMPHLVMKLVFDKIRDESPWIVKPITGAIHAQVMKLFLGPNIQGHLDFLENHLGQNAWFAGENITAADIQMSFPLEAAGSRMSLKYYPHLQAYLEKLHQRPAYQQALKKGGPYDYA